MAILRITISPANPEGAEVAASRELTVVTQSSKRLTKRRVARILAEHCPGFRRRRGRMSIGAGSEILPVIEEIATGWRAWRLSTGENKPSGFEPPLKGRVGKSNSRTNPLADRGSGAWERADIALVAEESADMPPNTSFERTREG